MNGLRLSLLERRLALVQSSAQLRGRLVGHSQGVGRALTGADRILNVLKWLRDHPAVPVAVAGLLILRRPRAWLRWGIRAWSGWRFLRRVRQSASDQGWF